MVNEEILDSIKKKYLYQILECKDIRSSSALYAFASFVNSLKLQCENLPAYFKIFESNNKYAIDALLNGYTPENFLDFVRMPLKELIENIFAMLRKFNSNEFYDNTLRVFCGYLKRAYKNVDNGYKNYALHITDLNSVAKFLDESKDQNEGINRAILDILHNFTELGQFHETDWEKRSIAKHAGNIRSDFFDDKRSLIQSMTSVLLQKSKVVSSGILPENLEFD